jgi:hypothetical protein
MKKRWLLGIGIALGLTFISLTLLGQRILPTARYDHAWRACFGTSGYLSVVESQLPPGSDRAEVEKILGEPITELVSAVDSGRFSLVFPNPHQRPDGEIMVSFDESGRVKQIVDVGVWDLGN